MRFLFILTNKFRYVDETKLAMEYKELSRIYYADTSADRESNVSDLAKQRREAPSSFDLEYESASGPLFVATPRELTVLMEKVLRREREISSLMTQIPGIAGDEVLRSLVFDEVISTNAIEDIHSTRKQIEEALREKSGDDMAAKRFREFATLYLDMTFSKPKIPQTPKDIRTIYDQIMEGELLEEPPDGALFRKDVVYVSNGSQPVHTGLYPEQKIYEAIEKMLEIALSQEIPALYSAIVSHYLFEYAHPFYDGNGRTGRYLLSLFLERALSKPTAISLSRAIANNKLLYYQAFDTAEKRLNQGELTFFVYAMLELILEAQNELVVRLEEESTCYKAIVETCNQLFEKESFKDKEQKLIFGLAQQAAFGMFDDLSLERLSDYIGVKSQQTRKYLSRLEEQHIVRKVRGRNPVTFALTSEFRTDMFPFLVSNS